MVSHLSLLADTCVQLKKDSEAKDEKIAQLEKRIHSLTMKLDTATSSEASMYTPLLANDPRCSSSSASVIEEAALSRASSEDDVNQTGAIMLMDRQKTGEPVTEFVVENVQERIERGDTWYTEAFSTHRNGYHMCLGVTVRRSWQWRVSTSQTQSYFLSVYAYLTPGESDDILRWPFRGDLYLSFHLDNDVIVKGGIIFNARSKPNASIRPHRRRNTSGEGCVVKVEDKQFKENLLISIDRVDVRDVCMQPIYH